MSTAVASARPAGSWVKLAFFVVFGLLTVFVLLAKNARIFDPTSEIARHFAPARGYLAVHALFARVEGNWPAPVYPTLALIASLAAERVAAGVHLTRIRAATLPLGTDKVSEVVGFYGWLSWLLQPPHRNDQE